MNLLKYLKNSVHRQLENSPMSQFYRLISNTALGISDFLSKPCLLGILLMLSSQLSSFAQTSKADLERNKQKIQHEIEETTQLIKETRKNKNASLGLLKALNLKLEARKRLIMNIQQEINLLATSISNNNQQIGNLEQELEKLKDNYGRIVRLIYMNKNQQSVLMLLFSAKDFQQAYKRLYYLRTYTAYRQQQAKLIQQSQAELADKRKKLRTDLSSKEILLGGEVVEKRQLSIEKVEQEKTVSELKKREAKLRKELAKKESDSRKLSKEIQRIIEREIAKERERSLAKSRESSKVPEKKVIKGSKPAEAPKSTAPEYKVTPETQALSGKFEANKGRLPWPVQKGVITETYGQHAHPVLKNITTYNNGIDIATSGGASVRAIFEGEVSGVIIIPGANMAVIIKHGEYLTVYSNLLSVSVTKGQKVKTAQPIGTAGRDESDSKSEAHLEIWKGKAKLNPSDWIAN
jgi:septal ring factor EnvC (AmiA/AmiB activator)